MHSTNSNTKLSKFGYASLTPEQLQSFRETVNGQSVVDLGCGNLELSALCLASGAKWVTAVDKTRPISQFSAPNFNYLETSFSQYATNLARRLVSRPDLALLSWPVNNDRASSDLLQIISEIETVLYLGHNDGQTTQCATPVLWEHLLSREPRHSSCAASGALIVYSADPRVSPILLEEFYAVEYVLSPEKREVYFEQLQGLTRPNLTADTRHTTKNRR